MTAHDDDKYDQLERALAEVHRSRTEPVLGPDLAQAVMRDVYRLFRQKLQSEEKRGGVDSVVWRAAVMTAGFAAVFVMAAMWYVGTERGELSALVAEEVDEAATFGE